MPPQRGFVAWKNFNKKSNTIKNDFGHNEKNISWKINKIK